MRNGKMLLLLAAAGLLGASNAMAAGKVVYVQVPTAEIRESKTPGSAVVAEVSQGTKLTVLSEEGVRLVVQLADGKKGYISKLSVSDEKPKTGGGLGGLSITDDRDITERRTAASGRGLSEAAKNMAKDGSTILLTSTSIFSPKTSARLFTTVFSAAGLGT